jgi:uncharacterized SAM-binding protein YcdF (DUF218 family)
LSTIVIFGCGVLKGGRPSPTLRARVEAAFRCGGTAADYMPTGAIGRHPPSEARVMAGLLMRMGVPAAQITLEETATDTLSSAVACAMLLKGRTGRVRIVSSGYHLPRCLMLMWMAGVPCVPCPAPPRPNWAWYWRMREAAALPYDAVLMALRWFGLDR